MHHQTIQRTYDLGNGVTLWDNGYSWVFDWRTSEKSSRSMAMQRPTGALHPDKVRVMYSRCGRWFYLPDYTAPHGQWLSVAEYATEEECRAATPSGILGGPSGHEITGPGSRRVFRGALPFSMFDAKSREGGDVEEAVGEMHKDAMNNWWQENSRHAKEIEKELLRPAGIDWTIGELLHRIGEWDAPKPPEAVVLRRA